MIHDENEEDLSMAVISYPESLCVGRGVDGTITLQVYVTARHAMEALAC